MAAERTEAVRSATLRDVAAHDNQRAGRIALAMLTNGYLTNMVLSIDGGSDPR